MSEMSEKARASAKTKAERLTRADPHARVDASGYSPEGAMDGNVQTGPRPISRRQFRRGGQVDGKAAPPRADRKQRASGGLTANSLINRDVKSANEERVGTKHVGGMKAGGRAEAMAKRVHKLIGGALTPQQQIGMRPTRAEGGKVHKDEAQDRKLIHEMGCKCAKCGGGRVERASGGEAEESGHWIAGAIKHPGSLRKALHVKSGHDIPEKKLEKAEHSKNPKLAKKAHLAETLKGLHKKSGGSVGRAAINDGTRPTGGRLARKGGGRTKKGTNVNIIIAPQGAGAAPAMPARPMPMPGPVGLHQGAPPPPAMPPPAAPGSGMPMRASGGRTNDGKLAKPGKYPIDSGAGGGLGRLEKAQRASRS